MAGNATLSVLVAMPFDAGPSLAVSWCCGGVALAASVAANIENMLLLLLRCGSA